MDFHSLFEVSYCLTLDKRIADYRRLLSECKSYGFFPQVFLVGDGVTSSLGYDHVDINELPPRFSNSITYPTWHQRPNAFNAWQAHRRILEKTLRDGHTSVLMLEDDAKIEIIFSDIMQYEILPMLTYMVDWDMLYLGGYHRPGSWMPTNNKNLIRVNGSGGWHGVIIKENVIRELLTFDPIGPYDWICGQYIHPIYNCYAVYPSIISQIDGFSYVEGHNLSKPSIYER